ncbi:hypothetical protein JCGZ_09438 [Jatropha curcas]|uniref:Uncharacterized protein n=1 Tax=Jatropha curcas TaxID=180498 RepID=A0A067KTX6_JATCU|nr:zinc finger A20 and AN1 domain-containing stress-associated protein 8 [Jatropha curcas]KDP35279.1 hypothetical protein JCGZ_09438 [Jatropha curcas]
MEQESQNAPFYCVNNCGFFGNAKTNNLCSKCYKKFLLKQPQQTQIESTIAPVAGGEQTGANSSENRPPAAANRCSFCRKRVGLTGFNCRCGQTFCSLHRYSDKHNCVFDYKSAGQDAIAKANPIVKAEKMDKI